VVIRDARVSPTHRPGRLARFVRHPATNLFVGFALIVSGLGETLEDIRGGLHQGFQFEVHHGVLLYGLFQVLSAIANLMEGLQLSVPDKDRPPSG
jgi:fumarate reductase subunit D